MLRFIGRSLAAITVALSAHTAVAQQQFVLDMGDVLLQGQQQIIPLKQEIMRRYNVRLEDSRMLRVEVVGKSEVGRGQVRVLTQNGATTPLRLEGRPMDFNNPAPYTFSRVTLDTRYLQSVGSFWQLETTGNIRIRRIIVVADRQFQQPQPPQHPPQPVADMEIHRFFTGRAHFWTLNYQEGINAGFRPEGVAFRSSHRAGPGMHQIFRCYNGSTHFVSRENSCEGGRYEGSMGFLSTNRNPQARTELIRCRKDVGGAWIHLVTTNPSECYNNGYMNEGTLGWVR